jgi:hypothetical protein
VKVLNWIAEHPVIAIVALWIVSDTITGVVRELMCHAR